MIDRRLPFSRVALPLTDRESGWDLSTCKSSTAKLPEYNALFDPNMRHFFENRVVQRHLHNTGQVSPNFSARPHTSFFSQGKISRQIDKDGRVIDLERNKGKLKIIEQEFKSAERIEHWRQKEEEEMRVSED